uniref:Uncharacterized protein n=1 Tax=Meloidogyne enterolobii TaxID=390850 RepID=A0A6V7XEM7_MELEN|nr:unnamed protein product [Meloidogyne enterolobii]
MDAGFDHFQSFAFNLLSFRRPKPKKSVESGSCRFIRKRSCCLQCKGS